MRDQGESDCPPTNIDIRMVVLSFGVLRDAPDGVDAVQESRKLHRAAQRATVTLPPVEIFGGGVNLLIG